MADNAVAHRLRTLRSENDNLKKCVEEQEITILSLRSEIMQLTAKVIQHQIQKRKEADGR